MNYHRVASTTEFKCHTQWSLEGVDENGEVKKGEGTKCSSELYFYIVLFTACPFHAHNILILAIVDRGRKYYILWVDIIFTLITR